MVFYKHWIYDINQFLLNTNFRYVFNFTDFLKVLFYFDIYLSNVINFEIALLIWYYLKFNTDQKQILYVFTSQINFSYFYFLFLILFSYFPYTQYQGSNKIVQISFYKTHYIYNSDTAVRFYSFICRFNLSRNRLTVLNSTYENI